MFSLFAKVCVDRSRLRSRWRVCSSRLESMVYSSSIEGADVVEVVEVM